MKLLVVNDQFERGGAGRVAAIQCNALYERGYDIVIVTDTQNWNQTYTINSNIPILQIKTKSSNRLWKWYSCSRKIRQYINQEKPDVIIAIQSMMFFVTWLGSIGINIPIIAADHTSFNRKIHPLIDFIRYHFYSKASGLSILTQKDYDILGNRFPQKKVIYNPISFPILENESQRKKNILCVGRLDVWEIKGFDIIISLWAQIHKQYPEWVLEIAGTGTIESIEYLENLIRNNNLQERVVLLGQISNMKELYTHSSIFALSSRMEGFPMALMEAMSQGCSCIAFSVYGATKEMMENESGIIVDDGDIIGFKKGLIDLLENENLREMYSKSAIKSTYKFTVDNFIKQWEELIKKVC